MKKLVFDSICILPVRSCLRHQSSLNGPRFWNIKLFSEEVPFHFHQNTFLKYLIANTLPIMTIQLKGENSHDKLQKYR